MWTKRYLDLTADRPLWAYLVDDLINRNVSPQAGAIRNNAKFNTFLQSWSPSTSKASHLPEYIKRMLKTAKKYNVSFAAVKLDERTKSQLPIWYHIGGTNSLRRLNNTGHSDCLRNCHRIFTIADVQRAIDRHCFTTLIASRNDYSPESCSCQACREDRERGCRHPHACCKSAANLLRQILPKWHPDPLQVNDGLTLTRRRKDKNAHALVEDGETTFNPSLTTRGPLSEAIRVFVDPSVHSAPPAIRQRRGRIVEEESCTVF
ncbi:uncharacterized protein C8Q71DRAFT_676677, partial [Rhodofomes roseus]